MYRCFDHRIYQFYFWNPVSNGAVLNPKKIELPKAESVGEGLADKGTRFTKGFVKGVWKNINPFGKKEQNEENVQ